MATKKTSAKKAQDMQNASRALEPAVAKIDALIAKSATGGGPASEARTALHELPDESVCPRLVVATQSADPRIRAAAVQAGAATPGRRGLFPLAAITACLADEEPKVRLASLTALNFGWGPKNEPAYASQKAAIGPSLEPLLSDENKTVASQAAIVWKRLGL